jgi:hypothetical protein
MLVMTYIGVEKSVQHACNSEEKTHRTCKELSEVELMTNSEPGTLYGVGKDGQVP